MDTTSTSTNTGIQEKRIVAPKLGKNRATGLVVLGNDATTPVEETAGAPLLHSANTAQGTTIVQPRTTSSGGPLWAISCGIKRVTLRWNECVSSSVQKELTWIQTTYVSHVIHHARMDVTQVTPMVAVINPALAVLPRATLTV